MDKVKKLGSEMVMLVAMLVLAVETQVQPPLPPYRRLDTTTVVAEAYEPRFAIANGKFFLPYGDACVAYNLSTMRKLWSLKAPKGERDGSIAVIGGTLYVSTDPDYRQASSHLIAIDAVTGKVLWSAARAGAAAPMASEGTVVFVSMKPFTVSAFDVRTRRTKWTAALGKPMRESSMMSSIEAVSVGEGRVLANCGSVTYCLDAKAGKPLWHESQSYISHSAIAISQGVAWIPSREGTVGRELSSGRQLWHTANRGLREFAGTSAKGFVGLMGGKFFCIDPKTGREFWSRTVGDENTSGGHQFGAVIGDKAFVCGITRAGIYDLSGKELWSGASDDAIPQPVWSDGNRLVCFDQRRLIRYEHGIEAAPPADSAGRQALAERLVSRFADLDQADIARLQSLGDDAFPAVLIGFLSACRAEDTVTVGAHMDVYDRYHALGKLLMSVSSPKRTPELLAALAKQAPNATSKPLLLTVLAEQGDPHAVVPYFIKELDGAKIPGFEMYESTTYVARMYVAQSRDPAAVQFMLKQLKDPKADRELRFEAYMHLAGTGGAEGLKAVLAERHHRTLLRPLAARVESGFVDAGEFGAKTVVVAQKQAADGRTWGLLKSGILGSRGDLWLAEKVNGVWIHPLFTGVSTDGISRWAKKPPPAPTFGGKTAAQLVAGAWFSTLVGNPALSKDSDGDGVTDIEELRLGTDPHKADSDGDGDRDDVDPWPNAPYRTDLSDAEQVLSAVFEARYHFEDGEGAEIFFAPPDMKPFEMPGRRGTMMWLSPKNRRDFTTPLERCYEQRVAFISFGENSQDQTKPWRDRLIKWNRDRTEATLTISTYFGGLNGTGYEATVRKFGSDWVVVGMRMAFVS